MSFFCWDFTKLPPLFHFGCLGRKHGKNRWQFWNMPNFPRRLWFRWKLGEFWIVLVHLVHLSSTPPAWMQYMLDCDMDKSTAEIGSYHLQGKRNLPGVKGAICLKAHAYSLYFQMCESTNMASIWMWRSTWIWIWNGTESLLDTRCAYVASDTAWTTIVRFFSAGICLMFSMSSMTLVWQEIRSQQWTRWVLPLAKNPHEAEDIKDAEKDVSLMHLQKSINKLYTVFVFLPFGFSFFSSSKLLRCRWLPTMLGAPDCPCQLRFLSRQLGDHDVQGAQRNGMQLLKFLWQV